MFPFLSLRTARPVESSSKPERSSTGCAALVAAITQNSPRTRLLQESRWSHLDQSLILLCLRDNSEDDLSNLDESTFVEIAMSIDPADGVVLSEVIEGNFPAAALEFVDDLYSASYGAPDALDRLESGRLGRNQERRVFSRELVDIVAAVVDGLVARRLSDGGVGQPGAGRFVLACEDLDLLAIAQNLAGLNRMTEPIPLSGRGLVPKSRSLRGWLALDVDQPKVTVTSVHGSERTAALEKLRSRGS